MDKSKNRIVPSGYVERHHIIPKSLGGTDDEDNIAILSGREHFVAHLLLAKIYGGGMWYALLMMCSSKRGYSVNSHSYELARKYSALAKTGTKHSEETKRKQRLAQLIRMSNPDNIAKLSNTHKGKKLSDYHKSRVGDALRGKPKKPYKPCPHCGKVCNKATAIQWHFDNCKFKAK